MATKRQATTPKTTKWPHMEAELAVHIAAILEYPFTPENLYNAIVDEMSDMLSDVSAKESRDSAEMIERVLNWHRGFGFRSLGQYVEEKLRDGRVVTRLKGGAKK
jgi:2-keto-4-pentenoate hydratase/2-oxohepta-3-ene-1,7-dioic acid hydratase in catechol pathway